MIRKLFEIALRVGLFQNVYRHIGIVFVWDIPKLFEKSLWLHYVVRSGHSKRMLFCVVVGRSSYFSLTFSRGQNAFKVKPQFSQLISYSASRNFFSLLPSAKSRQCIFSFFVDYLYICLLSMVFQCQNDFKWKWKISIHPMVDWIVLKICFIF